MNNKWEKVKLKDICKNISITEKNPLENGLERYIGLEHLDGESLKINRYGLIAEGISFTKKFEKGQILFGKRRAYQKKAAIADFNGICSGDILVFEAINDKINPKLLPYIIQNDKFFDYAVGSSYGSLSPRTNWKYLSEYEILLPDRDMQNEILAVLDAVEVCVDKKNNLLEKTILYKEKLMNELFENRLKCSNKIPLGSLGETYGGLSGKNKHDFEKGENWFIPYINVYSNTFINKNNFNKVNVVEGEKQNTVKWGDIIFTGSSETAEEVGLSSVMLENIDTIYLNSFCFGYRFNCLEDKDIRFYGYYFRSKKFRREIVKLAQGSTRFNLSKNQFLKLKIDVPSIDIQRRITDILVKIDTTIVELEDSLIKTKLLKKKLLEELFNPKV